MIRESNPCYPNIPQPQQVYQTFDQQSMQPSLSFDQTSTSSTSETLANSLLYNLSILKGKVHQVQSLATIFIGPDHDGEQHESESTAAVAITMGTLVQEIIVTASSMLFTCQQMSLGTLGANNHTNNVFHIQDDVNLQGNVVPIISQEDASMEWYDHTIYNDNKNKRSGIFSSLEKGVINDDKGAFFQEKNPRNYDIVELDAADLLAKYTHYCQVCGKGFKRDANLRMHMRAHGEEYKSSAALCNPLKNKRGVVGEDEKEGLTSLQNILPKKYSCPQEGCRWNKKHAKFHPLKSMICVKNHYKRSHCPKMYVCKMCNRKRYSVLSDLRTHEKHCGDIKWQCSCGSTFSRKDKLMGHVSLFIGHFPLINQDMNVGKVDQSTVEL